MDFIHSADWQKGDCSSSSAKGNPVITHGTPDSPYSMTACVMSPTGEVNGISGAALKVSLVAGTRSVSWLVVMPSRVSPIVRKNKF